MDPSSICTLCTHNTKHELALLVNSIRAIYPEIPIFILCDSSTFNTYKDQYKYKVFFRPSLETKGISRAEHNQGAKDFFLLKNDVLDFALSYEPDTLYIDTDQVVLDSIHVDPTYEMGVAPSFLRKDVSERVGFYSGGLLWVNHKEIPDQWRKYGVDCRYTDQTAIENLICDFSSFCFDAGYNFRCWRFKFGNEPSSVMRDKVTVNNDFIQYDGNQIRTVHTHFTDYRWLGFNSWIVGKMLTAKYDDIVADVYNMPSIISKTAVLLGRLKKQL